MKTAQSKSMRELVEMAKAWGLRGYTGLTKSELAKLVAGGLKGRTLAELTAMAREWGLVGLSRLRKHELVKKLNAKLVKFSRAKAKPARKKKTAAKAAPRETARARRRPNGKRTRRTSGIKAKKREAGDIETTSLPAGYRDGRMILLPRDPDWLYCYWDPTPEQQRRLDGERGMPAIRVIGIEDDEKMLIQPVRISHAARSWYFQVSNPKGAYKAELGLLDEQGGFEPIMSSNPSSLPPSTVSDRLASSLASHADGEQRNVPGGVAFETDEKLADKLQALSVGIEGPGMDSARALETRQWMDEIGSAGFGHKTDG